MKVVLLLFIIKMVLIYLSYQNICYGVVIVQK